MGVAMTIDNVVSLNKCSITNGVAMTIENVVSLNKGSITHGGSCDNRECC